MTEGPGSIDAVEALLEGQGYVAARSLATVVFLSLRLGKPLFLEGEAGVGYRLGKGFELPPLMFTVDEARALALATRLAQQWLDPAMALAPALGQRLQALREAAQGRRRVTLRYVDQGERRTERQVRPLGCFYWGRVWTLAAWCEQRQDFRNFRLDRMEAVQVEASVFPVEPGRTLADLLRRETGHSTWR